MPLPRLITLIVGIAVILGMVLWLIDSLYRLYFQISFTAPLLANLLLLLVIVLLGLLIYGFIYYFNLINRPQRRRSGGQAPSYPVEKTAAAGVNLQVVQQQVAQIEDEVTKAALLARSQAIAASLARGEFKVMIFGTGSAGKTSLINALIGEMAGEVGAAMGTTTLGKAYGLRLPGVEREILLVDTPGILEAGSAGTERGAIARQLATEADLLLFVVDNDLRQSEYTPLRALAEIGKRSLLIFNKTDLYPPDEQGVILEQLRAQVQPLIPPQDVVAIAAHPQPIRLENGETYQPESDILPLIKRLAAVLRAEGEDLIADNILLQSQRLGEEARRLIDQQRRRQADKIIDRFQWIGAGVITITPLPVVDLLATAAVNAQMVVEIGRVYGCELNLDRGRELALSLGKTLVSLGVVKGAIQLLATALQFNIATYLVGKSIQGVTAAYLTRIAGKSFIEYFRQNQDWGDGGMVEVVQQQFQLVQKDVFMKGFVKEAIAKVVAPLQNALPPGEQPRLELRASRE
ncbi:GTP-binding protein, partial [Spirulina sp. CCNP1310]|uniref:YcjF family protein n=1 Tax=Spirulina sp. CCNP1310 TaxID=3110249 RepID=UPI002B2138B0